MFVESVLHIVKRDIFRVLTDMENVNMNGKWMQLKMIIKTEEKSVSYGGKENKRVRILQSLGTN